MGAYAVSGLDDLIRTTGRIDRKAAGELRRQMRTTIGRDFTLDAKAKVDELGLVKTGRLRGSIRPAVKGSTLVVRSSPPLNPGKKSPQGYAPIYEFGGRGTETAGPRAFLAPTLEDWQASGRLEEELSGFLDWVDNEWGGTGGA